ncbi:polysaccharide deacetylase family protein [Chryseobacterium sp.]|uniref:polysaccharide deacetylase family protein n=1 Tax=Chryseobacterium sp. TaxID=1871047 RepID=UPI000EBA5CCD|nr:polysaccharide deacetylase family protein [Chryseobacterium sp.]HCA07575.1 hypothetical protein [Chryseobacterium sp.]
MEDTVFNKPISKEVFQYVFDFIFLFDAFKGKEYTIEIIEDRKLLRFTTNGWNIYFPLPTWDIIRNILKGDHLLKYTKSKEFNHDFPVFFEKEIKDLFEVSHEEKNIYINFEFLSVLIIMLTRYEEIYYKDQPDSHDRFSFENSLSCKYNFVHIPICDEYVYYLYTLLFDAKIIDHGWNEKQNYNFIPSHDIDYSFVKDDFKYFFKNTVRKFIEDKNIFNLITSGSQLILSLFNSKKDVCLESVKELVDLGHKYKLSSEFYFMAAKKSTLDAGYDPNEEDLKLIYSSMKNSPMVIALHSGYNTYNNLQLQKEEKDNLESAVQNKITYNRQHFLRLNIPKTLQQLVSLDFLVDSTLGYAENEGFRCGTSKDYYYFDLNNNTKTSLILRPLVAMDITLIDYRKLSIEEGYNMVKELNRKCEFFGGNFTFLWHNTTSIFHKDWFHNVYIKFLNDK